MTLELAFAARPSLWHLATQNATLTPQDGAHVGTVARRLLTFALSLAPDDHGLLTVGITTVNNTSATDPLASITLLRQSLAPKHLQTIGDRTLRSLADGIPSIATIDPSYLHDLYIAALQHPITSTATTSIGNSQILPLRSNAQQDYDMASSNSANNTSLFWLRRPPSPPRRSSMRSIGFPAAITTRPNTTAPSTSITHRSRSSLIEARVGTPCDLRA